MKIGVYGGSFDPIHEGHLLFAEQIRQEMNLDKVYFAPANHQYMKDGHSASYKDRCNMVFIAIMDNPNFGIHIDKEIGNTYTFDTMQTIKNSHPKDELFFIAGADVVDKLHKWRRIKEFGTVCSMIIGTRNGSFSTLEKSNELVSKLSKSSKLSSMPIMLCNNLIESPLSSTIIRERLRIGKTVQYMVPDSVNKYIILNGVYKNEV